MNLVPVISQTVNQSAASCRITCRQKLTGAEAPVIRHTINKCIADRHKTVYLDAKEVTEADLSGINEVINSHYTLASTATRFVFIYKTGSVVEKWVQTTGLDKFVDTALITAA